MPERRGQHFTVLLRSSMNSMLIEFVKDGKRYVTSQRHAR